MFSSRYFAFVLCAIILMAAIIVIIHYMKQIQDMKAIVKEKEFAAKLIKESYTDFYEHSPMMYFVMNPAGIVMSFNKRVEQILELKRDHVVEKPVTNHFITEPEGKFREFLKNIIDDRINSFQLEFKDSSGEGHRGIAHCAASVNTENEIVSIQMVVFLYECEELISGEV